MYVRRWEAREVSKGKKLEHPAYHRYFFKFNALRNIRLMNEVAENLDRDTVYHSSSYRYVLVDRATGKVLE